MVVCAGLYASGSTWLFNVLRQLHAIAYPAERLGQFYVDEWGRIEEIAVQQIDRLVVKTHRPSAAVRSIAFLCNVPIILTIRDPRDAVASEKIRFGMEFDLALDVVTSSCHALLPLLEQTKNLLLLRYEDGFTQDPKTIDAAARHLGIALTMAQRHTIFAALRPEVVQARLAELTEKGILVESDAAGSWELETQWHPKHVGDGRVGKWKDIFTESEVAQINFATRHFARTFGYDSDIPAVSSGSELFFGAAGTGIQYIYDGFSHFEDWGIWTEGDYATIRMALTTPVERELRLELVYRLDGSALNSGTASVTMKVAINGRSILEMRSAGDHPECLRLALCLQGEGVTGHQRLQLVFQAEGLISPRECGISDDDRRIGIGLTHLCLYFTD